METEFSLMGFITNASHRLPLFLHTEEYTVSTAARKSFMDRETFPNGAAHFKAD